MTYGYIRIFLDAPKRQKKEMQEFAKNKRFTIDEYFEETISTTKKLKDRKLNILLEKMVEGDKIIVGQLPRLGRNLMAIMEVLQICMKKQVQVTIIDEDMEIGSKKSFEALQFAFEFSEKIEHRLISLRTKEVLARQKRKGEILGRPKGRLSKKKKLTGKSQEIQEYLNKAVGISNIARIFGVHRVTMTDFIEKMNLKIVFIKDFKK